MKSDNFLNLNPNEEILYNIKTKTKKFTLTNQRIIDVKISLFGKVSGLDQFYLENLDSIVFRKQYRYILIFIAFLSNILLSVTNPPGPLIGNVLFLLFIASMFIFRRKYIKLSSGHSIIKVNTRLFHKNKLNEFISIVERAKMNRLNK